MGPEPFYFGCVGRAGHYVHTTTLRHENRDNGVPQWLRKNDGKLCGADPKQTEGQAVIHRPFGGWTVIAFWDRSVDKRFGSNSVFALPVECDGIEAIELAKAAFPSVWARFTFPVTLPKLSDD